MKLSVLSGKGGTGKTFVSVNLAAAAKKAVYVDCDVEEPNGHLFLKPKVLETKTVSTTLPEFDADRCTGCRKCIDFCRFNALIFIKKKPMVFPEVCHSCGGCAMVCPSGAISEKKRPVGKIQIGRQQDITVITGVMELGEVSAVPVIQTALELGFRQEGLVIVDCPPGSGCSVIESVSDSDYCILVAEPTAFGFHNFKMVHELVALLHKPCGVVINKADTPYMPLLDYCKEKGLPILEEIPYRADLARMTAQGKVASWEDPETAERFTRLLHRIGGEVQ